MDTGTTSSEQNGNETPRLAATGRGVTVIYKGRYLYSRIYPSSAIDRIVENISIRPETLVLCFSPVLGYGFDILLKRLPENCAILALEHSKELFDLARQHIPQEIQEHPAFAFEFIEESSDIVDIIENSSHPRLAGGISRFRRCLPVDMSGGAGLFPEIYRTAVSIVDEMISSFWRNRITLVKMGRLYDLNLFRNLSRLPWSQPFPAERVSMPIIVFGAGPSLDETAQRIAEEADRFYILAVDSAVVPLLKYGIVPDAVIAVESQLANEKSFTGAVQSGIPVFADLTSRPQLVSSGTGTQTVTGGPLTFFFSEFTHARFIKRLADEGLLPITIPPLGSVGLAAVWLALSMRRRGVPVFFTGLDFCYTPGKTHCKEAPSHRYYLNTADRLHPAGDPGAAYRETSFTIEGKDGRTYACDPALSGYGQHFCAFFSGVPDIFDIARTGMNTGCPSCSVEQMIAAARTVPELCFAEDTGEKKSAQPVTAEQVERFYDSEEKALLRLKDMLSTGSGSTEEILSSINEREYLFLHFADAHNGASAQPSFLKRVRGEIDLFLKDIQKGRRTLRAGQQNAAETKTDQADRP